MSGRYIWQYLILPYPVILRRSGYVPVYVAVFYKQFPDGRCLLQLHEPGEEYPWALGEDYRELYERAEILRRLKDQEA